MGKTYKVAFLQTHPIQYFSPLFKKMAEHPQLDLTVYYCSNEVLKGMKDPGFGVKVKWDIPLLEGYKYKFLKNYSPINSVSKPPFGLLNLGIAREIIKNKYDALIVHGWFYATYWIAYICAMLSKTPILIRGESPLIQEVAKPKWKLYLKKAIFYPFFKKVSAFLSIGGENTEFYRYYKVPQEKIFLTPYAVNNEYFLECHENLMLERDKIRNEIGISHEKVVIAFVGKLIEKKRPMDLLRAYEKIEARNKALIYVGDGVLLDELKEYVKKKKIEDVHFVGFQNQSVLPKFYIASDIFVLPSSYGETWGLVVNEAMCFRLPVVVSDIVGCGRDLVKNEKNGFVFRIGDIDELSSCLEKLVINEGLRKKMGEQSYEVISRWSYEEDIEGILRALESIEN